MTKLKKIETEKEVVQKEVKTKTKKIKTKQELTVELSKVLEEVFVEIINVSNARCIYEDKFGDAFVDLEPSENVALNLKQVKEICTKAKGFFTKGSLVITEVLNEEYSLNDIMRFLNLDKFDLKDYYGIDEFIMESDDNYFEKIINKKDKNFVKKVTLKALYLNAAEDIDFELSRAKEKALCNLLNIEQLIY